MVLHPGYAADSPVPVDPARRLAALRGASDTEQRYVLAREGSICGKGYCESPAYRAHLKTAIDGLSEAAAACAGEGVALAVENLNPRLTYLFQLPSELVALAHGFAVSDGFARILATRRVLVAHLHDNASRLGPPPVFGDDHALIGSGTVPLADAIRLLLGAGVLDLIAETTTLPLENVARLSALLSAMHPES